MHLIRFATTALAAATIALPVAALAAPGDSAARHRARRPAAPAAPALPSIPKAARPDPDIYTTLKTSVKSTILLKALWIRLASRRCCDASRPDQFLPRAARCGDERVTAGCAHQAAGQNDTNQLHPSIT